MSSIAVAQEGQPKIHFSETEYHFGDVPQGSKVVHKFVFKNEGNAPLNVTRVQSSCGCTAAIAGKNVLVPQESSEIQVTFNSTGRQGSFNKIVQVYSNDPLSPKVDLRIDGNILTPFTIQPMAVNVGMVAPGQVIEKEIQIKLNAYEKPVRITHIDKTASLEVVMKDALITRDAWTTLVVKLGPQLPLGYMNQSITLRFEDPSISPVTIRISGRVEGAIRVSPNRVSFVVRGDLTQVIPQKIQIFRTDSANFEIVKTDLDSYFFELQTITNEAGKRYELAVRLKEKPGEKFFNRTLKIYTTDESMKVIEIPIQVWISDIPKS